MSERPAKSIFAHKQTYSRKGNSKSRSVSDIAHEAERLGGACPHVVKPQPPAILEGIRPSEIIDLIENRVTEQNKRLRQLRKETPDRKDEFRGIRIDTHVMIASVFSFPDAVNEMDEEEYLHWRTDVIVFAKADAALNGAEVLSIVEHRDESYPHVHILAVPICADDNIRMDAKRCHEGHCEQDKHKESNWTGSPSRSYKQAMRGWQDRYHADVGSKHGQARTGPARRRLDRATWKREQERLTSQKSAARVELETAEMLRAAEETRERQREELKTTVAEMIAAAETAHIIAEDGLIATLRQCQTDEELITKLTETSPMPHSTLRHEDRTRMRVLLSPIITDGLDRFQDLPKHHRTTDSFAALLMHVTNWIKDLNNAAPRGVPWGDVVHEVTHDARTAFRLPYVPMTLAQTIEQSPAWETLMTQAKSEFSRVAAVSSKLLGEAFQKGKSLFLRG